MHVLIMGGTRFLGKYIVQKLIRDDYRVTSINIDDQASLRLPEGVESIFCNRKDHSKLKPLLQGRRFDAILDIGNAPTFPEDIRILLDTAGTHMKRYVFCSTSTVYKRPATVFPTTEDQPLSEGATEYTRNKVRCENFLREMYNNQGTPITIIRPRHIYGPENYSYREGFFFDRLVRGRPILIPGDGSTLTQFGYVEDIAEAFCLALEKEKAIGQAYTITGKECVTLDGYVDLLCEVTGKNMRKVHFEPKLLKQFANPGLYFGESEGVLEDGHTCYDIAKAKDHLGYMPKFSLEEGLRTAFKWYQKTDGDTYRMRVLDFAFEDELIRLATASPL